LFQTERWIWFLLLVLVDHTSLVIRRMISTREDTSDITRSFFSVALVCHAVTCASDTSRFEKAIIFGCAHIFDSLHIEQYPFCVWTLKILFYVVIYILQ
jgi:hypothetical protein